MPRVVFPPEGVKHRFLSQVSPAEHVAMMRHALLEMLRSGVIACGDFREQGLAGARLLEEARQGLPISACILARMTEGQPDDALLAEGRELLSFCEGLGVRDVESYPQAVLRQLRAEFPEKLFALHADETRFQYQDSLARYGSGQAVAALPWQPDFAVHLTHTPPHDLERLARSAVLGVACPRANLLLGDGVPDLPAWQEAGLSFGLGSDNLMVNAPDMLREMDTAFRLICGLREDGTLANPAAALRAATLDGARALKLERRLGSLQVGKEASFIAFDLSRPNWRHSHNLLGSLVHRADIADISAVYIKGRPLADWLEGGS